MHLICGSDLQIIEHDNHTIIQYDLLQTIIQVGFGVVQT